jgi:predicted small secreted protein
MRSRSIIASFALLACAGLLSGCQTAPGGDGQQLSETGKVALQEVAAIAVRRAVLESPRAQEKAANIRAIAGRLQAVTSVTSVTQLRAAVELEIDGLGLNPIDRADAQSLLNIFAALLREQLGKDDLDADALVKVNDFLGMIVRALPAAPG